MSELPRFKLKPLRSGYGFSLGRQTLTTETTSRIPRQRKDSAGTVHRVNAAYKCNQKQYKYFLAFINTYEALPFLAYLLLDDIAHHLYECHIINESIDVTTLGDQIFNIKLSLVVKPEPRNTDADANIIANYDTTEGQ